MTIYLGKSCSTVYESAFRKLSSIYVFSYFPLVLRAGYGIWLYQFLIIAYLFTLDT